MENVLAFGGVGGVIDMVDLKSVEIFSYSRTFIRAFDLT
jgi:hypothetical protein